MQNRARPGHVQEVQILGPLPRQNIDTGMGVGGSPAAAAGCHDASPWTDLVRPVIDTVALRAAQLPTPAITRTMCAIASSPITPHSGDHHRDGVVPATRATGYVLRRLPPGSSIA